MRANERNGFIFRFAAVNEPNSAGGTMTAGPGFGLSLAFELGFPVGLGLM